VDENLTYRENVQRLVSCGLSEEKASKCVDMIIIRRNKGRGRREEILREESEYRKEIGDLNTCRPDDESCLPEGDEKKAGKAEKKLP